MRIIGFYDVVMASMCLYLYVCHCIVIGIFFCLTMVMIWILMWVTCCTMLMLWCGCMFVVIDILYPAIWNYSCALATAFILFKTWLVCRVIEAGDVRINICYSWWDFPIWWILSTKISEASFFTLISIFLFLGLLFIRPLNIVLKVIFSIVFIILTWFY